MSKFVYAFATLALMTSASLANPDEAQTQNQPPKQEEGKQATSGQEEGKQTTGGQTSEPTTATH